MARYRNARTGDVVEDGGELGLAHLSPPWELVEPPAADEDEPPAPAPAQAATAPRSTPRKRTTASK